MPPAGAPVPLDQRLIADIAAALVEAHAGAPTPPPPIPDEAHASAIQLAVARRLGGLTAWKVGHLPGYGCRFAPIPPAYVQVSGRPVARRRASRVGIEAEIVLRFGRAFRANRPVPPTGEIERSVDAAFAAIELIDTRYADRSAPPLALLADNFGSGGLVIGAALTAWQGPAFARPGFALRSGGDVVAPPGVNSIGDVSRLIERFVRHCGMLGVDIEAGTYLATGSSTGLAFVEPPSDVALVRQSAVLAEVKLP